MKIYKSISEHLNETAVCMLLGDDYQILASLLLGSHHANFMKPFTGLQVQFKKTTDRIGIIVLLVNY